MSVTGSGELIVEKLSKTFERGAGEEAGFSLGEVSFRATEGKLFTILGPSGCGKTTTLRCIAGLETPDAGEIRLGDRTFFSADRSIRVRPEERRFGMVFQSYAIWPHMSVFENVAFPLKVQKGAWRSKRDARKRVEDVLQIVELDRFASRPATDLSGGQQQRMALARAIVAEPPLLLLDEPLSNLDAKLREQLRLELKRLQREVGVTAVYVTHDQTEALAISNMIVVMNEGKIQQIGEPREIYENPSSRFVADFIGSTNLLHGTVQGRDEDGNVIVSTPDGELRARSQHPLGTGTGVVVSIRPENVSISTESSGQSTNSWTGSVIVRGFIGEAVDHLLQVGETRLRARCNPRISIPQGTRVAIELPPWACSVLPAEDGPSATHSDVL